MKTEKTEPKYISYGYDTKAFKIENGDLYYRMSAKHKYNLLTKNFKEKNNG